MAVQKLLILEKTQFCCYFKQSKSTFVMEVLFVELNLQCVNGFFFFTGFSSMLVFLFSKQKYSEHYLFFQLL